MAVLLHTFICSLVYLIRFSLLECWIAVVLKFAGLKSRNEIHFGNEFLLMIVDEIENWNGLDWFGASN